MIAQILIITILFQFQSPDTASVTLEQLYEKVEENYPLVRKAGLQERITELRTRIAESGYYPRIEFSGMASYQSEVTQVDFVPPGAEPPTFSKDHYQFKLQLDQPIYTGDRPGIQKKLQEATGERENRLLQVELHKLREQINETYFSVLLMQQQAKSITLLLEQLREQLNMVRSRVRNGVLLPSQQYILEAERAKVEQDSIRTDSDIYAGYKVLSELVGVEITPGVELAVPEYGKSLPGFDRVNRPEYELFNQNQQLLEYQKDLSKTDKLPRLSAFGTGAYGRPGLNVFDDNLQPYFIVGLRVRWNFWDWSNASREMDALDLQQEQIKADEDAFSRQLQASIERTMSHINSTEQILKQDQKIIKLREKVVTETKKQLANGTITATEFVTELTKANRARLTQFMHEVQLVKLKIEYVTKIGIEWEEY